ncbi:MAG TPA: helix-hairpin-helix domain-containing protein [Methanobacteriaceae archaeon]|nr:helix-hairpin-helix domain-containing protein [Methanobacteriaceae archaeon]
MYELELRSIKGIGERMAFRIIKEFGSEEKFLKAAQNYEVDRLARIEGLSQRRAVEIINEVLGNPSEEFLKTGRAIQIYEDIIKRILEHTSTDYAHNRVLLLSPTKETGQIEEHLQTVMKAKDSAKKLPRQDLKKLLKKVKPLENPRPHLDTGKAILVENKKDYQNLTDRGINKYVSILTLEEVEGIQEYELVVYAYNEGLLELDDAPNLAMIPVDAEVGELVPGMVLSYYHHNQETIQNASKLREMLGWSSTLHDALNILDSIEAGKVDEKSFNQTVQDARERADQKMKDAIKRVDLSGDEVLDLLNKGMPSKIQDILNEVLVEAQEEINQKTGISFDPFLPKYPLEVDEEELKRVKNQEMGRQHLNAFEKQITAAKELSILQEKIEREVREVLEFDYHFALGSFAYEYDLHPPHIGVGFSFKGALHLDLAGLENVQKINYQLKEPDNVVLLTGANSGGKTTLLETMAQIAILTQMGMPVPAQEATVQLVDELYFFSKKRSLDAGAFESFLRNFIPIATHETNKLILLDELEAITELEAAVKIISSFMDLIRDSGSHAVIVTHLAQEILKYTKVRVDGIEATGLDEEYNLIVDRTPRMDYLARSTPELILKRVYEKSDGKLKKIYGKMLEKF